MIGTSSVFDIWIDGGFGRISSGFSACGNVKHSDSSFVPCWPLLDPELTVWTTSSASSFPTVQSPMAQVAVERSSLSIVAQTLGAVSDSTRLWTGTQTFSRARRQILQRFFALRGKLFPYMIWDEWPLWLTMWPLQAQPERGAGSIKAVPGSVCSQRSRCRYRLKIGSIFHHRWKVCRRFCHSFWCSASCFDDVHRTWRILSPTTAVLRISKMDGPFVKMNNHSFLDHSQWRRVTMQVLQGWPWMRTLVRLHAMSD